MAGKQPKATYQPQKKAIPSGAANKSKEHEKNKFEWNPDTASLAHPKFGVHLIEHGDLWHSVLSKLQNFAGMTWNEILSQTHDRGKSSNHGLDPNDGLSTDGQSAWDLADQDLKDMQLVSLRLNNLERIIGFRDGAVFHVIWYDPKHDFVKVKH